MNPHKLGLVTALHLAKFVEYEAALHINSDKCTMLKITLFLPSI